MKLPDATTRANLRLANPAQRFAWASQQLYAALFPSPPVAANVLYEVPAKTTTNKGATAPGNALLSDMSLDFGATEFSAKLLIPLNHPQYSRGLRLSRSLGELSQDTSLPYVGVLPSGEPIQDNSLAVTYEQYIFEQVALLMADAANTEYSYLNHITLNTASVYVPNAPSLIIPYVEIIGTVLRTGQVGENRYGDITGVKAS